MMEPLEECTETVERHCMFWVKGRQRYCKFSPQENDEFCSMHSSSCRVKKKRKIDSGSPVPQIEKRVRCPLNTNHIVGSSELKKHLRLCTVTRDSCAEMSQPFWNGNVNRTEREKAKMEEEQEKLGPSGLIPSFIRSVGSEMSNRQLKKLSGKTKLIEVFGGELTGEEIEIWTSRIQNGFMTACGILGINSDTLLPDGHKIEELQPAAPEPIENKTEKDANKLNITNREESHGDTGKVDNWLRNSPSGISSILKAESSQISTDFRNIIGRSAAALAEQRHHRHNKSKCKTADSEPEIDEDVSVDDQSRTEEDKEDTSCDRSNSFSESEHLGLTDWWIWSVGKMSKHEVQCACLLATAISRFETVMHEDYILKKAIFVELGAGKGELSRYFMLAADYYAECMRIRSSGNQEDGSSGNSNGPSASPFATFVLIDREARRNTKETRGVTSLQNAFFKQNSVRLRMDLSDFDIYRLLRFFETCDASYLENAYGSNIWILNFLAAYGIKCIPIMPPSGDQASTLQDSVTSTPSNVIANNHGGEEKGTCSNTGVGRVDQGSESSQSPLSVYLESLTSAERGATIRKSLENLRKNTSLDPTGIKTRLAQLALARRKQLGVPHKQPCELALVSCAKHLCGSATDIIINGLLNGRKLNNDQRENAGMLNNKINNSANYGLIATCCHHRCDFLSYPNVEFIERCCQFTFENATEFQKICQIAGWGTGATGRKKTIGLMAKRLLDLGRVDRLRSVRGYYATLEPFTVTGITPENVVIIITPDNELNAQAS